MGRNKEESMNIRKIRRLLHETKKIAETASLTGSLQGGARIAIRQYNSIRNHLQETGAIPEDLFQELDEDECSFDELGVTVTEGAKALGVTRPTLSRILNRKSAVSAEMAVRLEKAIGSSAGFWLRLQLNYDLAQVQARSGKIQARRLGTPAQLAL